jgi:hypothetical protein
MKLLLYQMHLSPQSAGTFKSPALGSGTERVRERVSGDLSHAIAAYADYGRCRNDRHQLHPGLTYALKFRCREPERRIPAKLRNILKM